jgi:hypothetical protein
MRTRKLMITALVLSAMAILIQASPATAASRGPVRLDRSPTPAEWDAGQVACLLQVIGQEKDLEFRTAPMECWLIDSGARSAPWAKAGGGASTASFTTVGTHYDGANFTGSYITIAGSACSGGWLDLSWDWINRISSTASPCWVGHFDGYGLTGTSEYVGYNNLSWLNNGANSLQYL